jgi:transcription termination factor Rho
MNNRRRFHRNKKGGQNRGNQQGGSSQNGLPMDVEDYLAEEEANAQRLLAEQAAAAAAPPVFLDENGQPLPPDAIPPGYDAPIPTPPQMSDEPGEYDDAPRGHNNGQRPRYNGSGQANGQHYTQNQFPNPPPGYEPQLIHIADFKKKTAAELLELAESLGLENIARTKKQDLIFALLKFYARKGDHIMADGVMEIMNDGQQHGFLRTPDSSYLAGPDDVYVSPSQVKRFNLRTGDTIQGRVRSPKDGEKFFALLRVDAINFEPPEASRRKVSFENLTPLFANEQYKMERGNGTTEDITARVVDIVAPFGKGQRGLIVSPPKAGKTILMQNIAQSIVANYPDVYLIVLLIDERPEEVTDMQRTVRGEVVASTFDEPASRHVQVAEMVIEKARRLVEHKRDVVILLDSITRLGRAYNTVAPNSGKILSGGVDANALQKPKRFFGAARNIEEGGSLTIIATALVDTGSKMDEVIYEEFKGTGNMEIHLERRIAEKRVFPAININRSGTRKEELMVNPQDLNKIWILRKLLHSMDELAAMELLFDRLRHTKTNSDFFDSMKRN